MTDETKEFIDTCVDRIIALVIAANVTVSREKIDLQDPMHLIFAVYEVCKGLSREQRAEIERIERTPQ